MVKAPSKRHSKSGREPVTIDQASSEAKITASPGDGGPFEGSPAGSASSFAEADGTTLGGQPERRPATQAGQTHTVGDDAVLQSDASLADEALIDTHFDAEPRQGEPAAPAQSSSAILHADRGSSSLESSSTTASATDQRPDTSRLPPDPYDTPEPDVSLPDASDARRSGAGLGALLAAAVAGGIISLAGYTALDSAGVFGSGNNGSAAELQALRQDVAALRNTSGTATGSADLDQLRSQIAALEAASDNNGAQQLGALSTRVEELATQLAQAESTGQPDLGPITGRLDALEAAVQQATQAQGGADQRFTTLEQSIQALQQRVEERANDPRLALAITASALKAAIDRGQSFQTELDAYAQAAPDAPEVAALRDLAEGGVPTRAAIAEALPEAADAMVAAGRSQPEGGGVFNRLWSSASTLVDVRPVGASVQGNEPAAVVARLEAAVVGGDYARALSEYDALPDASKQAGADFIAKVRARQTADDLVSKALTEALKA